MFETAKKTAFLVDFDGTVTTGDLSSLLPRHFDRERFDAVEKEYARRGIPIRCWLEENIKLLPADQDVLLELALSWAKIRPGFDQFLQEANRIGAPVVIASDGFGFYIEPILKRCGLFNYISVLYRNRLLFKNNSITLKTPHAHQSCRVCGNCKAAHVVGLKNSGYRVVYIGDGSNDRFGASQADLVLARDELARASREHSFNYRQWDTFYDILSLDVSGPAGTPAEPLCDPMGAGIVTAETEKRA